MYFESHAHYDDPRYDDDRAQLLESLRDAGVSYVVNVGADMETTKKAVALSEQYDFIYAAVGVHPHEAESMKEIDLDILAEYTKRDKVVAIGEIGLDFYYDNSPRDIQRQCFKKQLNLVERTGLPVIIHSRDAQEETFKTIKESAVRRGVIHCYGGSRELAEKYVELGFMIGIGGIVTFKNSRVIKEVVSEIPLEWLLIETDCPYLSPEPFRGSRNDSGKLKYIVQKIAEIKDTDEATVAAVTMENAFRLYDRIPRL